MPRKVRENMAGDETGWDLRGHVIKGTGNFILRTLAKPVMGLQQGRYMAKLVL